MKQSKRVALCLSGQMRTGLAAAPSIQQFFGDNAVDVFIHTWQESNFEHETFSTETHRHTTDDVGNLCDAYSPVAFKIDESLPNRPFASFESMFYSIMMANRLKRQHELKNNFEYDLVIRCRLDLVFDPTKRFSFYADQDTLMCSKRTFGLAMPDWGLPGVDDLLFWGESKVMDIICDSYRHYVKDIEYVSHMMNAPHLVEPKYHIMSPGHVVYRTASTHNIFVKEQFCSDVIMRKPAERFNPLREFEKVKEVAEKWKGTIKDFD